MQITFIGGGNMASALIGGWIRRGGDAAGISVVEPQAEARARLARDFGVRAVEAPDAAALRCDLIVLAVKPQQMREVCAGLAPGLDHQTVLSIAAGLRAADLSRWLGGYTRIVRAMPNTPALIGQGVTGLYADAAVSDSERAQAEQVLAAVGSTVWVAEERLIDAVTALSGSGPAYVFHFIEAMVRGGEALGLSADQAHRLAVATFTGAAALAAQSPESPGTLRERVTSKGGTTEAALKSMAADGVADSIVRALAAAAARGAELGDQLGAQQAPTSARYSFLAESPHHESMLTDLILLVLNAVAGFVTTLLLARFYMQWARVSFRNQLGQFVIQTTDWAVLPARKVIPAVFGLDMATFVVAWLLQVALLLLAATLQGGLGADNLIPLIFLRGLFEVARLSVWFLIIALLISAVLSWVSPGNPLGSILGALTRPFLQPIQRVMPPIANVDLSPLVLILLLQIVLYLIDAASRQIFALVM